MPDEAPGLVALEKRVRQDLEFLNYPLANWVPATPHAAQAVTDLVIVGGGMCGLVAAFACTRVGIRNLRIVDRAPEGAEGPWVTYARMETLRSPKELLGPAYGMASLTFQAWFRAQFGDTGWEALFRIPRPMWMDYLRWYRRVLAIPVENGVEVLAIAPAGDGLLELQVSGSAERTILARKIILANGREGLGAPSIPDFIAGLPRTHWAHSSDAIDFDQLRGRRVVVIGVGASAVDNAGEALENGAAEVRLLARRAQMPTINKLMGLGSYGLTAGWPAMSPAWRWRFLDYSHRSQTPAPRNSTQRVGRHPNGFFHFGCAVESVRLENGEVVILAQDGRRFATDFVILGTGFSVDTLARPELAAFMAKIATWGDRYQPPPEEANGGLATYPWLSDDFSFTEKRSGSAPWLRNIHCFNYGAALSLGKVSGDIPAISEGAQWLARGRTAAQRDAAVLRHDPRRPDDDFEVMLFDECLELGPAEIG
ncbi:MAG: NAD(P)/FAD-dependent oxidoreductase, partial [Rhizobiales bacterium]|nr:NAD(P)/FAD-dependent oxidoreductase [Hyphomicrobiales bacterium]